MLFGIDVASWYGTCYPGSDCWWSIWPSLAIAMAGALITRPARIGAVLAVAMLGDIVWRQVLAEQYSWPRLGFLDEHVLWKKVIAFLVITIAIYCTKGALNWIVRWRNAGPTPEDVVADDEEAAQDEDVAAWRWFQYRSVEQLHVLLEIMLAILLLIVAISVAVAMTYGVVAGLILFVVLAYVGHRITSPTQRRLIIYDGTEDFRAQYRQRKKKKTRAR